MQNKHKDTKMTVSNERTAQIKAMGKVGLEEVLYHVNLPADDLETIRVIRSLPEEPFRHLDSNVSSKAHPCPTCAVLGKDGVAGTELPGEETDVEWFTSLGSGCEEIA